MSGQVCVCGCGVGWVEECGVSGGNYFLFARVARVWLVWAVSLGFWMSVSLVCWGREVGGGVTECCVALFWFPLLLFFCS